jgi:biotin carboxyl carrier protein
VTPADQPPRRGAADAPPTKGRRPASVGDHDPRTAEERVADHAAIDRLADELLPALVAKLSATGLAEIEVGEGSWTVRVRRPADGGGGHNRRATDRPSRSQPGHAGHGHAPAGFEGHRSARDTKPAPAQHSTNGASPASADADQPGSSAATAAVASGAATSSGASSAASAARLSEDGADRYRVIATSPAVGVYQPRAEAKSGTRVRSGDRLGAVDMLGIPQEVVAPADGIVGASLVEAGETVEYGQELVIIELAARAAERSEA